jgi:phospholipid/cholesterol/gamma-HCH transport system substrate-binding protein
VIRNLRKNLRHLVAILVLGAIGTGVGLYLLSEQGLRFPLLDPTPVKMTAVLDDASAVTPGQGQTVQVAGVRIGDIASVEVVDGRAHVGLDIDPRYVEEGLIRSDATALLRPRTALKDMYVQVFPGSRDAPPAREGFTIPISRTLTDVDLDEIWSTLTPRVRDYLTLFVNGAGRGLHRRGDDLAEVFRRFGPTMRDLARVNRAVARERRELRQLVTSLARLNEGLAERPEDLSELVQAAEATFGAFASEDDNLRATISELPETLRVTRRALADVGPFADELGPATTALIPVARALERSNPRVTAFANEATPLLRNRIRPFIRESRPLVRELGPTSKAVFDTSFELRGALQVLNTFFNMLAFNPNGTEPPDRPGREEGYLFWLAWVSHQGANLINIDDANGPMRPVFLTGTCTTLANLVNLRPELEFGMGLSPILAAVCGDPQTSSVLDGIPGVGSARAKDGKAGGEASAGAGEARAASAKGAQR